MTNYIAGKTQMAPLGGAACKMNNAEPHAAGLGLNNNCWTGAGKVSRFRRVSKPGKPAFCPCVRRLRPAFHLRIG